MMQRQMSFEKINLIEKKTKKNDLKPITSQKFSKQRISEMRNQSIGLLSQIVKSTTIITNQSIFPLKKGQQLSVEFIQEVTNITAQPLLIVSLLLLKHNLEEVFYLLTNIKLQISQDSFKDGIISSSSSLIKFKGCKIILLMLSLEYVYNKMGEQQRSSTEENIMFENQLKTFLNIPHIIITEGLFIKRQINLLVEARQINSLQKILNFKQSLIIFDKSQQFKNKSNQYLQKLRDNFEEVSWISHSVINNFHQSFQNTLIRNSQNISKISNRLYLYIISVLIKKYDNTLQTILKAINLYRKQLENAYQKKINENILPKHQLELLKILNQQRNYFKWLVKRDSQIISKFPELQKSLQINLLKTIQQQELFLHQQNIRIARDKNLQLLRQIYQSNVGEKMKNKSFQFTENSNKFIQQSQGSLLQFEQKTQIEKISQNQRKQFIKRIEEGFRQIAFSYKYNSINVPNSLQTFNQFMNQIKNTILNDISDKLHKRNDRGLHKLQDELQDQITMQKGILGALQNQVRILQQQRRQLDRTNENHKNYIQQLTKKVKLLKRKKNNQRFGSSGQIEILKDLKKNIRFDSKQIKQFNQPIILAKGKSQKFIHLIQIQKINEIQQNKNNKTKCCCCQVM